MKYSGIGGQAVIEGVMMRNKDHFAVAVRKPDQDIEVKVSEFESISNKNKIFKMPLLRGIVNFVESLYIGMKALSFSSQFFEENENNKKQEVNSKEENLMAALVVTFSILLAIGVFMMLPYGISLLFQKVIKSNTLLTILEGVIRFVILISYIYGISFVPDIKRVYMYHGAEHKAINCVEEGLPLTVKNVRKMTKKHLRCGTSFIIDVIILSVILFMFIRVEHVALRLLFRILLVPVIAAVAYEFLRIAGSSRHPIATFLSMPGLWFQSLTTKEPDDSMIEVAIKSIEAVFDWEVFLENFEKKDEKNTAQSDSSIEKTTQKETMEVSKKDRNAPIEVEKKELISNKKKRERESTKLIDNVSLEEEDDEILNALDRFFNNHRIEEKNKRK